MKKILLAIAFLSLTAQGYSAPCTGTWQGATNSWNTAGNWSSGCVPGTVSNTDTATFLNTGVHTILLNVGSAITLQSLTFNPNPQVNYTINQNTVNDMINFNVAGSTISLSTPGGSNQTINPAVNINADTTITMVSGSGFSSLLTVNIASISNSTLTIQSVETGQVQAVVQFPNVPTFTSGNLVNKNTLDFTGVFIASELIFQNGSLILAAGNTISNSNSGNLFVANTTGTTMDFSSLLSVTLNGSTVTNQNTGQVEPTTPGDKATGSHMLFANTITVNAGTLQNINSGPVTGGINNASIGSWMEIGLSQGANSLNITGGTVLNSNSGSVDSNSFGALMEVHGDIAIGTPGGTLQSNDTVTANNINITNGGILLAIGHISGTDTRAPPAFTNITNGGTVHVSSGTTPGTLNVQGTYSQSGTLIVDLLSDTTFSQLSLTGSGQTTHVGGNLNVVFLPGDSVSGNTPFTLVNTTSGNSLSGTFDNVTYSNLPAGLTPSLQYNFGSPGTIILSFSGQRINPTSSLPTTYAGGFIETVLSDINHLNSHITIKMEDLRGRFSAQGAVVSRIRNNFIVSANERFLAFNPETEEKQEQLRREVVETEKVRPGSFYFGPTGRAYGEIHSKDGDPGAHYWSVGGLMGVDYAFSEVGIGAMADYERIFVHAKDNWGSIDVDELHASIYLTYSPACIPLAINAIGGGAYEYYNIKRNTTTGKVRGKPRGFGYDALFGFEYALGGCNFHFIPLANAQYIYLRADSFNEKGSAGAIHIDSQRVKSLRSSLGFRLNYYNETNDDLIVIPEFYAEWQREYMNRRRGIGISPIAGIGGTILLPGTGRNIWLGGVDLLFTYRQKFGVEVSYETEYNSLYHDHFFYLGANFRF